MAKEVSVTGFIDDIRAAGMMDVYTLVDNKGKKLGDFSISQWDHLHSLLFQNHMLGAHVTFGAVITHAKYLLKTASMADSTKEDKEVTKKIRYRYAVKYDWLDKSEFTDHKTVQ